jgi:hypothetical protein
MNILQPPGVQEFFVALENLKRRRAKYSKDSYLYVALLWDQLMERDSYLRFFDLSPGGRKIPESPPDKSVKGSNMYGYIYTEGRQLNTGDAVGDDFQSLGV